MTFRQFVMNLSSMDKEKLWDKAVQMRGYNSKPTVDIWLEILVELYEKYEKQNEQK